MANTRTRKINQNIELNTTYDFVANDGTFSGTVTGNSFVGPLTGNVTGTVSSLSNHDTGDLDEGTNLYFTTTRARDAFSAGTGVAINAGEISIGQSVGTTDNVTFGVVTASLSGNASTASALATARNIALDGSVTGNADFDGSGNITITTTTNHNHDDRYYTETESDNRFVNVSGDTMTGNLNWGATDQGLTWAMNTDGAYIKFFNTGDGDTDSRLEYATSDNGNEYHRFMISGTERMKITATGITATGYNKTNWDSAYSYSQIGHLPLTGGTLTGQLTLDDKLTITGTTNNFVIDEEADGTWHLYDTFQDNGIVLYSGSGGMDFQYNGVTEMTIDGSGVSFTGTINLDAADLNIGSADIIFGTAAAGSTRGLVWSVDGIFLSKLIGGGTDGGKVTLFANMDDAITTGNIFEIKDGSTGSLFLGLSHAGILTAGGGTSTQWNTAYTYSQVGHLPLAGGVINGAVAINLNTAGLTLNRDAVTNYNGIYFSTANSPKWFVGMRENLSSNNHIHYSEQLGVDVLTLNVSTGDASVYGSIYATGGNSTNWNTAYSYSQVGHLPLAGGTLIGNLTVNSTITLPQNPVGTTYGDGVSTAPTYMIQQAAGDNDGIRLYAEAGVTNDVKMIFEVVDDIEAGDTWVFRNKQTYSPFSAVEAVKISGAGDITAAGTISATGVTVNGNAVIHAGNIGDQSVAYAGNAGTLDSIDSTQFLRSDVSDFMTGNLSVSGTLGANATSVIAKLQVGANYFTGANGIYDNTRIGSMVNGSLTSMVYASQYNSDTYPDYGMVFIHGPNTSSYNVWSISPDGPAKGDNLNFIYGSNATNIHSTTPKVIFDGNGFVGIGVQPVSKFHVSGAIVSGEDTIQLSNTTSGGITQIGLQQNDADGMHHRAYITGKKDAAGYAAGQLGLRVRQAGGGILEAVTIRASGYMGVGTDAPDVKLHIQESAAPTIRFNATSASGGAGSVQFYNQGAQKFNLTTIANSNDFALYNNGGTNSFNLYVRHSDGSVGIGTTSPIDKMHIVGGLTSTGLSDTLNGAIGSIQVGYDGTKGVIRTWNSSPLLFSVYNYYQWDVSGSAAMYISTSRNVGINTTSPSQPLDVSGIIRGNAFVSYANTNRSSVGFRDWLLVGTYDRAGAIEIGDVSGARYGIWGGGYDLTFSKHISTTDTYVNVMQFLADNETDSTVDVVFNSGNIGILTTSPQTSLQIGNYTTTGSGVTGLGLTFAAQGNGSSYINFFDGNNTEGTYIRSIGEQYGGNLRLGARWDDYEDKMIIKMYQTSAGAAYNIRMGIGTTDPQHVLDVNGDINIPGTNKIVFNNEPVGWYIHARNTVSTTFMGTGLKNTIISGGGVEEGIAFGGASMSTAMEVKNSGVAYIKDSLGIGATDFSDISFGSSRLKVAGTRATLGLTSSGTLSTIAMYSGGGTSTGVHINQGSSGKIGFYQYSYGDETFALEADGVTNIRKNAHFGRLFSDSQYVVVSEQQIYRTSGLFYINGSGTGNVSMVSGGGKVLINSTTDKDYPTKLFIDSNLQYSAVFEHNFATAGSDYRDALFLANTNSSDSNFVSLGMATTGGDGQHHRFAIHAHKSSAGNYAGYAAFMLRQTDTTFPEKFRMNYNGDFHADGDVIAYSSTISDKRLKDNVKTIDNALDKVKAMRGVEYVWNNGSRKGQKDLGLIAQEVEQVLPEIVREKEMPLIDDSGEKYKSVDYEKIVGVLIEAIKELSAEVEQLKKQK